MTEITLYFDLPIDYFTYQLRQQFHNLSENELKLLAIIYLSGLNADIKKEVVNRQIFKSLQTVENHLSKFRKEKIENIKLNQSSSFEILIRLLQNNRS